MQLAGHVQVPLSAGSQDNTVAFEDVPVRLFTRCRSKFHQRPCEISYDETYLGLVAGCSWFLGNATPVG